MSRVTRSASRVAKPAAKRSGKALSVRRSEKVQAAVEQAVQDNVQEDVQETVQEDDFQLPSDSEDEDEEAEGQRESSEEESDSELAVHADVISQGGKSESTNKSGHTITKPSSESNKSKKNSTSTSKRGVIYIGRLPNGFEEKELKTYFQQFGDITRLRLSRNKKTGNSKHYAFIEFKEYEVAKVASETMNNYLLMGHLLKCTLLHEDKIHENLFNGANKKFKVIPFKKISLARHDKKRTVEEWEKLNNKHLNSIKAKQDRLKEKGIDYDLSDL